MNEEKIIDFRGKVRHHPRLHFPQLFSPLLFRSFSATAHNFFLFIFILFFAIAINNQFHKSDSLTHSLFVVAEKMVKILMAARAIQNMRNVGEVFCVEMEKINAAPRKKGTESLVFTLHFTQSHHIQMLLLLLFPFFTLLSLARSLSFLSSSAHSSSMVCFYHCSKHLILTFFYFGVSFYAALTAL